MIADGKMFPNRAQRICHSLVWLHYTTQSE